jgi:hypothetical protein
MYKEIVYLFPSAIPLVDFVLQDDGLGATIKNWNTSKLGAQPTQEQLDAVVIPARTTLELDTDKYLSRANAKNRLMAEMAAMNIGRLKAGTWTTAQLVALMADPEIKSLVSHMETLSFELAISVINNLTNPLITPDIKATWVSKLMAKL